MINEIVHEVYSKNKILKADFSAQLKLLEYRRESF